MKLIYQEPVVQVLDLTPEHFIMQSNEPFDPTPNPGEWETSSLFESII